jgi:CheY-like chemotaxis protein
MNILVTDDSKMARKMLIKNLQHFIDDDTTIFQASNGEECLQIYKSNDIDLVFLDLTMPVMDGFEALKLIRQYDQDAKVVVVSADIQKTSLDKIRQLKALDFVKKPINLAKMEHIFHKLEG